MRMIVIAFLALISIPAFTTSKCNADEAILRSSQVVDAPPRIVYQAVQNLRTFPGHQLESYDGKNAVIKEVWTGLPLIGNTICVYRESEISQHQIDYKLVSSDKITRFEGSWTFQSTAGGKKTLLTLSTLTKANINLPFAQMLTERSSAKRSMVRVQEAAQEAVCLQSHQGCR